MSPWEFLKIAYTHPLPQDSDSIRPDHKFFVLVTILGCLSLHDGEDGVDFTRQTRVPRVPVAAEEDILTILQAGSHLTISFCLVATSHTPTPLFVVLYHLSFQMFKVLPALSS